MSNIDFWTALVIRSTPELLAMGYTATEVVDMRYAVRRDRKERRKGRR